MNIWYLTSEFPPDFGGGISMYVQNAASMFAEKGHKVTVLVRDAQEDRIELTQDNMRVIRFLHMRGEQYSFMGYWTALAYQYAEEVLTLIDKDGYAPDIIEVQDYNAIGYYVLLRKWLKDPRLKDVAVVVHLHTPTFELSRINQTPRYAFPTYWIGQMEKFCLNAADALVTQSEFLKKQIQPYVKEKEITVIPLPYEFKKRYEQLERNQEKSIDLLYLGRLEYRKGVTYLLKAMEELWDDGEKVTLRMLGGDTYFDPKKKMMGEFIKEKYAKRIEQGLLEFKNSVPPDQLEQEILSAKSVVIPSLYENYPYNCLISMSLGCPVIVSSSGGQAEMVGVSETNGFIFDWGIQGDFKNSLRKLLYKNSEELDEIGKNGYNRIVSLCNIEENVKRREKFFLEVIKNSKSSIKKLFPVSDSIPPVLRYKEDFKEKNGYLSIIIPYYNLGEYIQETLESALAVDYRNFEIIIVNDGSTDQKSIEILERIRLKKNPQIRILDIANGGLANARNVGARNAKGEYIAFLDADDLISPDFYGKAINVLEEYENISFVYSWVRYFGSGQGVWPTFNTEFPYFLGMNMLTAFVVVRKDDFLNYGINRDEMEYGMEDYDCWVSMCSHGCSGVSLPEPLVQYRVRAESMSRQFNRDMVIYLLDRLSSGHPELYNKFGLEIYNLLVANGPGYLWNNPTFKYPEIGFMSNEQESVSVKDDNSKKYELMRIASSKRGAKLLDIFFKYKLNRFFK